MLRLERLIVKPAQLLYGVLVLLAAGCGPSAESSKDALYARELLAKFNSRVSQTGIAGGLPSRMMTAWQSTGFYRGTLERGTGLDSRERLAFLDNALDVSMRAAALVRRGDARGLHALMSPEGRAEVPLECFGAGLHALREVYGHIVECDFRCDAYEEVHETSGGSIPTAKSWYAVRTTDPKVRNHYLIVIVEEADGKFFLHSYSLMYFEEVPKEVQRPGGPVHD